MTAGVMPQVQLRVEPPEDRSARAVRTAVWTAVAVQTSVVAWAALSGWFHADDFAIRAQGAAYRWLDPDVVLQNWGGHFMPGGFVIAQLLGKTVGFGYLAYGLSIGLGQALVAVLLARTLLRNFGERWRVLLPLGLYLLSIPVLQATVWWASALNAVPFLACLVLAADRAMRLVRRPTVRDQVWLVGIAVGALLFFEKAVLLPVMVVLILLATTPGARGGLSPATVLRRWRGLLAAFVAMYAVWFLAYRASGPGGIAGSPDWAVVPEMVSTGLMGTFASSLVGGPWAWEEAGGAYSIVPVPETVGLLVSGAVLALAALASSWGPRARGAILMVAVHAVGLLLLIAVGRSAFLLVTVALPRYFADLTVVLAIGASLLLMRLKDDPAPAMLQEWRPRMDGRRVLAVLLAAQVLVISWAAAATSLVAQLPDQRAKDWTSTAAASFSAAGNAGNSAPLLDSTVPFDVMTPILAPQNRYSWFFAGIPGAPAAARSTDQLRTFWPDGALGPARVVGPSSLDGPSAGCGWAVDDAGRWIPMQNEIVLFDHTMRIQYLAGADTDLVVEMNQGRATTVPVRQGLGDVYLSFVGGGTSVKITPTEPGAGVCVDRITIGAVAPGQPAAP